MEGENIVMILFSGVTEYSDRKVIILPRYSIPRLPLSNAVVVCYGRVHCRIQSWIPGSVLFRLTDSKTRIAWHMQNVIHVLDMNKETRRAAKLKSKHRRDSRHALQLFVCTFLGLRRERSGRGAGRSPSPGLQ